MHVLRNNGPVAGTITAGTGGDTKKPLTTNATGIATGLNADRLDSLNAAQIIANARTKAGLAAETADDAARLEGQTAAQIIAAARAQPGLDADTLDGADSTNLVRAEEFNTVSSDPLIAAGQSVATETIAGSTGAFVMVTGHVSIQNGVAFARSVTCDLRRSDGSVILAEGRVRAAASGAGGSEQQITLVGVDALPATGSVGYALFCDPTSIIDNEVGSVAAGLVLMPLVSAQDDTVL